MYKAIGKERDSGGCQGLLASLAPSPLSPISSDLGVIRDIPGSEYSFLGTWESSGLLTCIVYVYVYVSSLCVHLSVFISVCAVPACPAEGGRKSQFSSPSPSP